MTDSDEKSEKLVPEGPKSLIVQAMVSMGTADGQLDGGEQESIGRIYQELTGETISDIQLAVIFEHRRKSPTRFVAELAEKCRDLEMGTKETILRAAYMVLLADGEVAAGERKKLKDFASALKISEIHFSAILEDLTAPRSG